MTDKVRIIVVGGGYGGTMAAISLARQLRRHPVSVTLIDGATAMRERVRFHEVASDKAVKQHTYARLLRGTGVDIQRGWVTRIDAKTKTIYYEAANQQYSAGYDYLIYATGSRIDLDVVPGIREHTLSVSNLAAAEQLRDTIAGQGRVVVVGGGLTGIELTSELAESHPGLQVALMTRSTFAGEFSVRGQAYIRRAFARLGIEIIENSDVTRISAGQIERAEKDPVPFDTAIWNGGFVASDLAQKSGLPVNKKGQLLVDGHLRSLQYPSIYGVGDSAYIDDTLRMSCAVAEPMGAYAANHLTALLTGKPEPEPFSYGYIFWCVSLGRKDGIVQRVSKDDRPIETIYTGWERRSRTSLYDLLSGRYT